MTGQALAHVSQDVARDLDPQFRHQLARLQVEAGIIARMPGLKSSIVGANHEETAANVMAIGLSLLSYGVTPNMVNVNQFDIIQGQAQPSCQLQIGLVSALCGHSIVLDEGSNDQWARATLTRADNGEAHTITYTVEDARKSHALDFWHERWANSQSGKRYLAEKVVVGTSAEEAAAATRPQWAQGEPKCNPAWHDHRADMLKRRALKRVVRFGAPEVAAGLVGPRPVPDVPATAPASISVPPNLLVDADEVGPEIATDPAPPVVTTDDRRVARLRKQVEALPTADRNTLLDEWQARKLPPVAHPDFPGRLDEAEDLVDEITARALDLPPEAASTPIEAGSPVGREPDPATGEGAAAASSAPEPGPSRPLAQQIAMQAKAAGIDHHHVIEAVTGGEKTSAKSVTTEEGQLTLQAIAAIAAGEYELGQGHDGAWTFVDKPTTTPDLFDQGHPFD